MTISTLLGLDFYGESFFQSPTSRVKNITEVTVKNAIYDGIQIRERTDVNKVNQFDNWEFDTILSALFDGNLEGGNVASSGLTVEKFVIKRRKIDELTDTVLAYKIFGGNDEIDFTDYSQGNEQYIYTINPILSNNLEGVGSSVQIESDFVGYYLVDVETNEVFSFDKLIGGVGDIEIQNNQQRTQIDTFSRFPRYFYSNQNYHSMSLSGVLIPTDNEHSFDIYNRLLNLVSQHKPLLVKGSNGSIFICDAHDLRVSTPQNSYQGFDYATVTLQLDEVMTYEDYMATQIKEI